MKKKTGTLWILAILAGIVLVSGWTVMGADAQIARGAGFTLISGDSPGNSDTNSVALAMGTDGSAVFNLNLVPGEFAGALYINTPPGVTVKGEICTPSGCSWAASVAYDGPFNRAGYDFNTVVTFISANNEGDRVGGNATIRLWTEQGWPVLDITWPDIVVMLHVQGIGQNSNGSCWLGGKWDCATDDITFSTSPWGTTYQNFFAGPMWDGSTWVWWEIKEESVGKTFVLDVWTAGGSGWQEIWTGQMTGTSMEMVVPGTGWYGTIFRLTIDGCKATAIVYWLPV